MTDKMIKFRPEWFGAYGLDKDKNFLQAPLCECGCGEKACLVIEDNKELFQFMNMMLMENDCNHCAIAYCEAKRPGLRSKTAAFRF